MRILIYVEPLPEKRPLWKEGWLNAVGRFVTALRADDPSEDEICIVTSDALARRAADRFPDCRTVAIPAGELIPALGPSANVISQHWYEKTASANMRAAMRQILMGKISSFAADVCITFSPAPFLKDCFPDAAVLHFEYGMMSRAPFPETAYLDPFGMYRDSALGRFPEAIQAYQPTAREVEALQAVRTAAGARILGEANPLRAVVAPRLADKRAALLVALQFSDFYAYDSHATITQQTELLRHVLDRTPLDIAVIASEHPENRVFDRATFEHFRTRHKNLIWEPEFRSVYAAGQYLVDFADAIVTVSSSVGLHSLLWRKRLIVLGSSHLDIAADAHDLSALDSVIASPRRASRENTAAWLVNHYYHPYEILFDPRNLRAILERATPQQIEAEGLDWFQSLARPRYIAQAYNDAATAWASHFTAPSDDNAVINLALYAATESSPMSEPTCVRASTRIGDVKSSVSLFSPNFDEQIREVQINFADRPVQIFVFAIALESETGSTLWRWNGDADLFNVGTGLVATDFAEGGCALVEVVTQGAHLRVELPAGASAKRVRLRLELCAAAPDAIQRLRLASATRANRREDLLAAFSVTRQELSAAVTQQALATQSEIRIAFDAAQKGTETALTGFATASAASEERIRLAVESAGQALTAALREESARILGFSQDATVRAEHRQQAILSEWGKTHLVEGMAARVERAMSDLARSLEDGLARARDAASVRAEESTRAVQDAVARLRAEWNQRPAAQLDHGAALRIAEHSLERERAELDALRQEARAHVQRIRDLEGELRGASVAARAWQEANQAIRRSTSWRLSAPLRWLSPNRRPQHAQADLPGNGDSGRSLAMGLWRLIPIGRHGRAHLKSLVFRAAPDVFRNTRTFREWQASQSTLVPSPQPSLPSPPMVAVPARMQDASRKAIPAKPIVTHADYVNLRSDQTPVESPVRTIAFYLPQFHPIPENDAWWGKGFTEWTNVTKASPQYIGHYQPHLPDELGFYDLRVPAVQERQAELARIYGVSAFCFYFYWFAGKRLLETPILQWLRNPNIQMPFCLCWANENWSRRWDGLDSELLIGQEHSPEDDLAFIAYVAQYLRDPRYVRVNGKPLLLVYRPSLLPDPRATAQRWRQWCKENGIGEIHLSLTQSFDMLDPHEYGFDAAVEFPPNNMGPPDITDQVEKLNPEFGGTIYDYDFYVERSGHFPERPYTVFRGAFPSWDNEARRLGRGVSFQGATPEKFRRFVRNAASEALKAPVPDERIVFINAWNEWAEGAHLEPDRHYGYAWLEALRQGLEDVANPRRARHLTLVAHDAYRHGAQYLALNMARVFSRELGFELEIVILGSGPLRAEFAAYGNVHDLAGIDPRGPLARQLAKTLKAKGADHAICNTAVTGLFLQTLSEEGIDCIALIHELPGVINQYGLSGHLQAIWERAKLTVYPSAFVRDKISPPADRPAIVRTQGLYKRNGARTPQQRMEARQRLRSHFNLPADAEIVLSVAYGDRRKGIDLWAALGEQVMQARPNAVFVWVGEIEVRQGDALAAAVKATGRADRFLFPGFQSQTDDFYAGADVYALLSREDPFPTVIMESLDVGVPVVAFDGAGGFSDLLHAGVGVLAPMGDMLTFARGVIELLSDRDARRAMGERGRETVRTDYSFRRYCFDLARYVGAELDRVSVVVPNYDYARHLSDRFSSALNQGFPVYELIVLDDRSSDDSVAVAQGLLDRLEIDWTLQVNPVNSGSPCRQWLKGAAKATGDFVWIAEADDLTLPGFLKATLPAFRDREVVMSYCQSQQMAGDGAILSPDYLDYVADIDADKWRSGHVAAGHDEIRNVLAVKNTIPNVSACVFRRDALVGALEAHIEEIARYRVAGDWATYVRVLERGKIAFTTQALNLHRRHERSVTIGSFNEKLLHEILSMQRAVRQRYGVTPRAEAIARAYAQELYVQFGLASGAAPEVFANPAFAAYQSGEKLAAE